LLAIFSKSRQAAVFGVELKKAARMRASGKSDGLCRVPSDHDPHASVVAILI